MPGITADVHVSVPVLRSSWRHATFVHWPYPPHEVQRLLPRGLVVDEYDGEAWVTLTPFVMTDVRLPATPALPWISRFAETNLRTYVRGPDGSPGVWFLSLEAGNPVAAVAGRLFAGAPYHAGDLEVRRHDRTTTYAGVRRDGTAAYRLTVGVGEPLEPSDRDVWLTARWRAFTCHARRLLVTPVEHEPWPLAHASLDHLEESLTTAAGLPAPQEPPVTHFSDGVHQARIGAARPVG